MQQTEVHDPACRMKVDPSKAAASLNHEGVTVYFCGQGCAAKFRASPEKYLQAKPDAAPLKQPARLEPQGEYTCPMHPEVKQPGPGKLPHVRHGARTCDHFRACKAHGIHMSDASSDCA